MKNEFVTYEQAVKLKELGFDGKCIGFFYTDDSENFKKNKFDYRKKFVIDFSDEDDYMVNSDKTHYVSAPLKQQAILFLLNKCDEDGNDTRIEYFGDESGDIDRDLGFGTLWDAIQILISLIEAKS